MKQNKFPRSLTCPDCFGKSDYVVLIFVGSRLHPVLLWSWHEGKKIIYEKNSLYEGY